MYILSCCEVNKNGKKIKRSGEKYRHFLVRLALSSGCRCPLTAEVQPVSAGRPCDVKGRVGYSAVSPLSALSSRTPSEKVDCHSIIYGISTNWPPCDTDKAVSSAMLDHSAASSTVMSGFSSFNNCPTRRQSIR